MLCIKCSTKNTKQFKKYLETKFKPGMNWDNWGVNGWHIDHIIPISRFNLLDPMEVQVACHYTNLQPLWSEENLKKGAYNDKRIHNSIPH